MNAAWQIIVDFVGGKVAPQDFAQRLQSDSALRELLSDPPFDWQIPFNNCTPLKVLEGLNFGDPDETYQAQGVLVLLLDSVKVPYTLTSTYYDMCQMIRYTLPRWLNIDTQYISKHYFAQYSLTIPQDLDRPQLSEWFEERLKEDFRYHTAPPSWLNGPEPWPIGENGPYQFVGQINLHHPKTNKFLAGFYVFADTVTGELKTFVQGYDPQAEYRRKAKQNA